MDAVKYLKEKTRMTKKCDIFCADCMLFSDHSGHNIDCYRLEREHPEKAVKIIEKWSKEHPQETYLQYFRKAFPALGRKTDEFIAYNYCVRLYFSGEDTCCQYAGDCLSCWNRAKEE